MSFMNNPVFPNPLMDFDSIMEMANGLVSTNGNNSPVHVGDGDGHQAQDQDNTDGEAPSDASMEVEMLWIGLTSATSITSTIPMDLRLREQFGLGARRPENPNASQRSSAPIAENNNDGVHVIIQPVSSSSVAATSTPPSSAVFGMGLSKSGSGSGGGGSPNPPIRISHPAMFSRPPVLELSRLAQSSGDYHFYNIVVEDVNHGSVLFFGYTDLRSLESENEVDLSKNVAFHHGGVEFSDKVQGPKLVSLCNIKREDFGESFNHKTRPTDNELAGFVKELGTRMNALYSQYNETKQVWLFLVHPSTIGGKGSSANGNA